MEYISGNLFVRVPQASMKAGEVVLGHTHNFDHTTYVQKGSMEISLLNVTEVDANGNPLESTVDMSRVIHCTDQQNWCLILKGRYHLLRALEDGTVYHCIYAHREPQAMVISGPAVERSNPMYQRDESGVLWMRIDEKIVQETNAWADAYR